MACPITISGNVFNDNNAGIPDGTGTLPTGLFANLVNSANTVVGTAPVSAAGAFTITPALNNVSVYGNYTVQLSTNQGVVNSTAPAIALPATLV